MLQVFEWVRVCDDKIYCESCVLMNEKENLYFSCLVTYVFKCHSYCYRMYFMCMQVLPDIKISSW